MKSIDRLTNQVADLTTQNRMTTERIAELATDAGKNRLRALGFAALATIGTQEFVADDYQY